MATNATSYGNDTIEETLGERNQVRTRPQIYFGGTDVIGAMHAVLEIITNGADELNEGHGTGITTIIEEDWDAIQHGETDSSYIATVIDDGRGVPMDLNPKNGKYNWHLVYNQLFASGKRGNAGAYAAAAGLNGVGAAITQFTADWMKVISRQTVQTPVGKQNIEYEMNFKDGNPEGQLIKRPWSTGDANVTGLIGTGTYVRFKTCANIFSDTRYTFDMLADELRKIAIVSDNKRFSLKFCEQDQIDFIFPNGITDYLNAVITEPLMKETFRLVKKENTEITQKGKKEQVTIGVNVAFNFSNTQGYVESFHNCNYVRENGTHYQGAIAAIKDVLETFGKQQGKLTAKEKIYASDLDDVLFIICSSNLSPGDLSDWLGQDKRGITNQCLYDAFRFHITENFRNWLTTHKDDGLKVIEALKLRKEAREKADQIKKSLVKQLSAKVSDMRTRPQKLHDCPSRDINENEIYIVEGDSAEGSALTARMVSFQATYPLTGVILNCEKATPEQILGNRVIRELIQIVGTGIEIPVTDKHMQKVLKDLPKFDINKLNYGKIIILTDADLDGYHICSLLIVFFAILMPDLLRQGKVYVADAPLFKIVYSQKTYEYAYTEQEKQRKIAAAAMKGLKPKYIKRFKGLGEMDEDELSESVMAPETRRLTRVDFNDEEGFRQVMQDLLGDNIDERKAWIREYFEMVSEAEEKGEADFMAQLRFGTYE